MKNALEKLITETESMFPEQGIDAKFIIQEMKYATIVYQIFRCKKNGDRYKNPLVTANSVKEAWDLFNNRKVYLRYNENAQFVCYEIQGE